jgi:hypothetical protein
MKKNIIIAILGAIFAAGFVSKLQSAQHSWSWTVPDDVSKIMITSAVNGKEIFNHEISVTPGQTFVVQRVN